MLMTFESLMSCVYNSICTMNFYGYTSSTPGCILHIFKIVDIFWIGFLSYNIPILMCFLN
ncbi:hypothetical protein BDV3_000313 [Batrachochytrium dendrobatidis]